MEPIKSLTRYHELADPQMQPRYTGIPTFFRTPYEQDLTQVDIGVIGVPFDGGVTNRPGARHGPREVRNQSSLMRKINASTGVQPFAGLRVRDLGDAWIEQPFTLEGALSEIEAFYRRVVTAGVRPLSVGGDHSVTLPILRAVGAAGPVGMVHIDAHGDTGDEYMGSRFHHGTPFRRAVEAGVLDPNRVIQIGLRGHTNVLGGLWSFSTESGMRVMPMDELQDRGWRWAVEEARRVVGDGPTYLSFDIDSLDPVYAPGTGTPEAGGITMIDALRMVRGLTGLNIVGGDVVEVSPPFDVGGLTAFHGASMLFEILCLMAAP
jgi:guanidinopropionase